MEGPETIDRRLKKISQVLQKYLDGDFSVRQTFEENGDEVDEIIRLVNELGAKVQRSGQLISDYETRVTAIMNLLLKYTFFDFSEKAEISPVGDEIDAIALALNTLGEELNDRIQNEKKHSEQLEKLAVVLQTTADAVMSFSPEGEVTLWNQSAERIFGYTAEEMIGRAAANDFTPEEEKEKSEEMFRKVMSGQQVINEHARIKRKDGRIVDVSITLTPIVNEQGQLRSISALSRDITAQKKAELALRENEERFRSLVEGVKDYAIIMLDPNGLVSTWNKGAESMKGYKAEEIIGKSFETFSTPEDRAKGTPQRLLDEAKEHGKANIEGLRVRKDGSTFWGYIVLTCLHDTKGKVLGYSKITRDLTENKKKDDEIRRSNLRLEQKNFELERMNKELASFAYVSSHDLQEPLRKIQTFSSRILETDYKFLSEQGKDYFNRLNSSANRMQQLILDILDYSKVNTTDTKKENTDLHELTTEILDEYKDQIDEKQAEVQLADLPVVPVVRFQYKQLISNLLSNALKFSDPARKPLIQISYDVVSSSQLPHRTSSLKEKYCHIVFKDNGIGFEPHFSKQIFEVFQRLHSQEVYKGTGIGLAICKKIVENHEGQIVARSELDKGSHFDLYLPMY